MMALDYMIRLADKDNDEQVPDQFLVSTILVLI